MKCPICKLNKSKRVCLLTTSCICNKCCGTSRQKETCHPCGYYREPKRDYKKIPFYRPDEMNGHGYRQSIAHVIEETITTFDYEMHNIIRDDVPIRIIEQLLDIYYFSEQHKISENELLEKGFQSVLQAINDELSNVPREELVKILGAIYFVANRRTTGQREYLSLIRKYIGVAII
jgi:hypothetical protein